MRKKIVSLAMSLLLVCSMTGLTACSKPAESKQDAPAQAAAAAPASGDSYTFISAKPGGTWYILTTGYSKIFEDGTGATSRIDASTGGTQQNVQIVGMGDADFGLGNTRDALEAYEGTGYHEGKARPDLRSVFFLSNHTTVIHLVVPANSPIKTLKDIDGKRINAGVAGGVQDYLVRGIAEAFNLNPKIENLSISDAVDRMKDGMIDGIVHGGGAPISSFTDLATTTDIRFIDFSTEELDILEKEFPGYLRMKIPAGTYPKQDKEVATLEGPVEMVANKNVPDDVVYNFLKKLYETSDEDIVEIHKTAGPLVKEDILKVTIPLHPGAVKYYEEQGIKIPAELIPQ